ncbi:hypothetical protein SRABI106_04809 [Rahnella aquatilis]|nr:hypothetical protein SRABI106_04809 [Rahnella aquatilis]
MGNKQQAGFAPCQQRVQYAQHLLTHRDVQRRRGLVGDNQIGFRDQHHGDHDALPHAAGNLVRIQVKHPFRVADIHRFQHRQCFHAGFFFTDMKVNAIRLVNLMTDAHQRIQREFRVLHNHGNPFAADFAHLALAGTEQLDIAKLHAVGADAGTLRRQFQQ